MYGHRDATLSTDGSTQSDTGPNPYTRRPSSIPSHLSPSYTPTSHSRRASVADMAADMMGPQGNEVLGGIRKLSAKLEDYIDIIGRPLKSWTPGIGRFLIVVTFLEDALRILTQLNGELNQQCVFDRSKC